MRRRSEHDIPYASSSPAVPTIVERTSSRAFAADRPETMPASSKASMTRPRNAGPDPASAVAASNSRSSSRTTVPSSASHSSTPASASPPANRPSAKHRVPAHTRTPTFGMARNTGTSSSTIVSSVVVATPAATDSTARSGVIRPDTSRSTRSTSIGLTATITMSARSHQVAVRTRDGDSVQLRRGARRGRSRGRSRRCGTREPGRPAPIRRPSPRPCCLLR